MGAAEGLIGVWRLVSWEHQAADGPSEQYFGVRPLGLVIYEPGGYMSAQIMRSDDGTAPTPTPSQTARALARDYIAYYGRYEVDEAASTVTHHVEASVNSRWVGGDQVRRFQLDGDRLVLRPPREPGGGQSTLSWERVGRF